MPPRLTARPPRRAASTSQARPPRRLPLGGLLAFAVAASACSAPQRDAAAGDPDGEPVFAGVQYPAPAPTDPGQRQRAVPPPPAAPRVPRWPPPPPAEAELAEEMRNAALRDQHYEQLLRGYFGLVEALYREFGAHRGAEGPYDPLPLARVHLDLQPAMRGMARRAEALTARLGELAAQLGVAVKASAEAPAEAEAELVLAPGGRAPPRSQSRAARMGRIIAFGRCVGDDLQARLAHVERLAALRGAGKSDDELRADPPATVQMARDMALMVRTLQCSKQATQLMQDR